MKLGNFNVDSTKVLKTGATVIGVVGMLLTNVIAANDQKKMKDDLKNEILNELSKENN